MSRPKKKTKTKETKFQKICRMVREQDRNGIAALNDQYWYYHEENGEKPMQVLAREGQVEAVWFMIENYHQHADDAVLGFAEAGLVDEVNKLLEKKSRHHFSNWGDYDEYSKKAPFVAHGFKRAVKGYAFAGLDGEIDKLSKEYADSDYLDAALQGHIKAERWEKVEELAARGAKFHFKHLPNKILANTDIVAFFLSLQASGKRRKKLLKLVNDDWESDDQLKAMLLTAADTHRIMQEYHLNYSQAKAVHAVREKGDWAQVRIWLLQCIQTVKPLPLQNNDEEEDVSEEQKLPLLVKDIYFHISSLMLGLSINDTKRVMRGVHENLFEHVAKANAAKLAHGLFTTTRYFAETAKAIDQYENRRKHAGI